MSRRSVKHLELIALQGIPLVHAGDDLAALIAGRCGAAGIVPRHQDVFVVAQKIVSKAEGRLVALASVQPSAQALALAADVGKDPRIVELILAESVRIVRQRPGLLIAEHRLGFVMANAGIDRSNVGFDHEQESALLLPIDPDASAERLCDALSQCFGCQLGVVISDSFGRPWRNGTVGVAIGVAGLPAVIDRRGAPDLFDRPLQVTTIGLADEVAAAASLLMGQAAEAQPAVLVRGLAWEQAASTSRALVRPAAEDLFR
jgi:coenzyme F420-0:L-glutamate ligase/coenzyme F420-1:gamma-L-glutamate ligase